MLVLLDTNVVLTGAFNPFGPSGKLHNLRRSVRFLYSTRVISECSKLIQKHSPNISIANEAYFRVVRFLKSLEATEVADTPPTKGILANGEADTLILGSALASGARIICTYNIKDFPSDFLEIKTPLSLHRLTSSSALDQYIQNIHLSDHGTLLLFAHLDHISSCGPIFESPGLSLVVADKDGYIRLLGNGVSNCNLKGRLPEQKEFCLTIRYNPGGFEAALWNNNGETWVKTILTQGKAMFSPHDTRPLLFFVPNHSFSGYIQGISGLPRYVPDKKLPAALDNFSLEACVGSIDLKKFLLLTQELRNEQDQDPSV